MEPTYIEHDLWTETKEGKITLTFDDQVDTTVIIAKEQRPHDLAMIALKILDQCIEIDPTVKLKVQEYIDRYL